MSNLFIDIGTHMGQGLLSLIKRYNMEQGDWLVHTFEPHPFLYEKGGMRCIDKQIGSPHSFKDLNESLELVPSIVRHSKACGGSNRKVDLYFDKNLEDNHMGNTIVEGMYTNPYFKDYREDRISFVKDPIKVDCIDVCQFILDITKKGDIEHLVIKIDCEGAEFEILNRFLESDVPNIFNVKICDIYCEFHHHFLTNGNQLPPKEWYRELFRNKNITLYNWE